MSITPSRRPRRIALASATVAILAVAGGSTSVHAASMGDPVGPRPDGTAVTPVGFRVTPAGSQSQLGSLPTISAPTPDGKHLIVVNSGDADESVMVVDTATRKVTQTITYKTPEAVFAGIAITRDGSKVYVSGGGNNKIRTYSLSGGTLTEGDPIQLPTTNPKGAKINLYPAGLALTPDGRKLVVADSAGDAASVVDLGSKNVQTVGVGHAPYGVVIDPKGRTAYVTNQGGRTVSVLDVSGAKPKVVRSINVGTHPNRIVMDAKGTTLYVANGDNDTISVVDVKKQAATRTISLAPYRGAQVGANPDGLALADHDRTLYVANSGDNDVAVVDTRKATVKGLVPTAWYPTDVKVVGGNLLVLNAKGVGAGPNPGGPNPYTDDERRKSDPDGFASQYAGQMIKGSLSALPVPTGRDLAAMTKKVAENDGFGLGTSVRGASGAVVPRHVGEASPIKHVIYIVKENRTFDQEFGSLGKGNGDPKLNLFGDDSAPNARALQRQYVTLDNFYANAEVSAQGWNWAVAANSNPYSEQTWVGNYSGRNHDYPSESGNPAIAPNKNPKDAYIWDRLADAGVSFANFGYYVESIGGKQRAFDPRLDAKTNRDFLGFDLSCPDSSGTFKAMSPDCGSAPRIDVWKKDFASHVAKGDMPSMQFVRLSNDHTAGTKVGSPTPKAYVADNDWALGQLVDTVSHSPYWKDTAIFVTEDDAQAGPDHVDAHRTISQVISPYTRTGKVDSTQYSTASMVRTMELILGIRPMTQFDTFATPMTAAFTGSPDATPYSAIKPSTDLAAVNGKDAPMAKESGMQNLKKEDKIDMQTFNKAIWASVKGKQPMPAPRIAGAVATKQQLKAQAATKDADG